MAEDFTDKTDKELQDSLDTHLLPSMMDLNVSDAFDIISNLCHEMRESEILCRRLDTRLAFLRSHPRELHQAKKVPVFANTLGHVIAFLKKYSAKKLLQRIALNRIITQRVRTLHEDISELFRATKLDHVPEMSDWLRYLKQDIANQLSLLEQLTLNHQVSAELVGGSLEEALTELKFEIDGRMNKPEVTELMARVLASVEARAGCEPTPQVPRWYIRRDDVELVGDIIDLGSFGEMYKAKWGADKTDVVVKSLYLDTPDTQKSFRKESEVWYGLCHPHIIKMHGGCHVGKPLFFVAEYASGGNFADFFKDNEENKRQMWRLFHQAAQGLLHLHTRTPTIVHGDIKCNNMLVGSNGTAKLCDFRCVHIKTLSVGESIKEQSSAVRWKAPECLLGQGVEANPSTASDTYAFGMSIIEAVTGEVPYGMADDESIINQVASGDGYPRPAEGFTDKQWNLVQQMTAFEKEERLSLENAIEVLKELAGEEKHENELNYTKEALLIRVKELETWLEKSDKNKCEVLEKLRQREKEMEALRHREEDAKSKVEELEIPLQREIANRIDGPEASFQREEAAKKKLEAALQREEVAANKIKELELVLQRERNKYEFEEPKGIVCDQCGDLNPIQNRFCSECGNDIEIIRFNKPKPATVFVSFEKAFQASQ